MSNLKAPVIFTANRLLDGEAVWLGANGRWVESPASAVVSHTAEELEATRIAAARGDRENHVVEPYEMPVTIEAGAAVPASYRERIRAAGPTIRLDLGKQAQQPLAA
ncbi:DUF2849 domain-containing protein [Ahrensia sp. R2A130]|uniref:DUF2849 domain-containing protein n=1 Tax=Ahrensia sp. R2A130 TaxID=744979 RepID=UPI0001E0D7FC|nr:DUF2849 domain-containing protein [Ahrensia sp. R2A130]EFL90316.1 sulphite or nitrite reductase, ferredoxin dependent [Ahrensia sp. R2A130]